MKSSGFFTAETWEKSRSFITSLLHKSARRIDFLHRPQQNDSAINHRRHTHAPQVLFSIFTTVFTHTHTPGGGHVPVGAGTNTGAAAAADAADA